MTDKRFCKQKKNKNKSSIKSNKNNKVVEIILINPQRREDTIGERERERETRGGA